jgi:glycosyltransferase involved in cell wall biosynthesis
MPFANHGLVPTVHSIWRGGSKWENMKIERFQIFRLWSLPFWIIFWSWKRPSAFREVLTSLWNRPCPNLQNWNETFLGLGYALVEAKRIESQNFSLLHGVWATMPATAAFTLSKLLNLPFSMGAHAYDLFRKGGDWLLQEKFKYASMIRTSSQSSAKRLYELVPDQKRIKVIRRGLSQWPVRPSFDLSSKDNLQMISVGRLVEKKGYFLLLRILLLLKQQNKMSFSVKIVGGGPLNKSLQNEIDRVGLTEQVKLVGPKSEKEVSELFLESDIMLFTGVITSDGDRDGIPNVIPEAMSAGCLVLASSCAGASEAIVDGVSGFSLNPNHPETWIELVEDFAINPSAYDKIRKKAQVEVRERFDVNRTARNLRKAFELVLESK